MRTVLLLLLSVFIVSCNKSYKYIEIVEDKVSPIGVKEKDPEVIKAENDSAAYIKAYESYCVSLKVVSDMKTTLGESPSIPKDFKLLNSDGEDISKTLAFQNIQKVKDSIYKSVFSEPNCVKTAISTNSVGDSYEDPDKNKYYTMCQYYVKKCLSYPEEADFDLSFDFQYDNGVGVVSGFVDSKNAYGVKVRFKYDAYLKLKNGDWSEQSNWHCYKVIMTGNDNIPKEFKYKD